MRIAGEAKGDKIEEGVSPRDRSIGIDRFVAQADIDEMNCLHAATARCGGSRTCHLAMALKSR